MVKKYDNMCFYRKVKMTRRAPAFVALLLVLLFSACPVPPIPPHPVYVNVEICTASGLVPNEYCPTGQVVVRQFIQGTQPTDACAVHVAPPPAKTKVAEPWVPGAAGIRGWSGGLYSLLAWIGADEAKLDSMYEAMAVDYVQLERNFGWYSALGDDWEGTSAIPWNADWSWNETYWAQLDRRLKLWCGDRDGTEIISILDACSLYDGTSFETNPLRKLASRGSEVFWPGPARDKVVAYALELAARTKKYGQRIILETRNEGDQIVGIDGLQSYDIAIITALRGAGWPANRIQTNWFDSSLYYAVLHESQYLAGVGLASTHRCTTPGDVAWYVNSPGKQGLMKEGDWPGADGGTFGSDETPPRLDALGLTFKWLKETPAENIARRPNADQIRTIMGMMKGLGYPRYELLSASAFQYSYLPNLDDAIALGRSERLALSGR